MENGVFTYHSNIRGRWTGLGTEMDETRALALRSPPSGGVDSLANKYMHNAVWFTVKRRTTRSGSRDRKMYVGETKENGHQA